MPSKPEGQQITDTQVEASKEIYKIAREQADIEMVKLRADIAANKEEAFSFGVIRANKAYRDYSNFLDVVVLYRMHKSKAYKKAGQTWEEFCEAAGYPRRTAETMIADIAPIFDIFGQNLPVLAGITINDIRWLGKSKAAGTAGLSEDGKTLIIGDDQIPATPEDIAAYINHEKEAHKKQLEEKDETLAANQKVLGDKQKLINTYAQDLARLEKKVKKSDLTPEEQDACNLLAQVQTDFITWRADIKKKIEPGKAPEIALRQLYFLYIFMSKICMEERLELEGFYQGAEGVPWEITEMELPPTEALVDNLPLTQGMGKAYKEKIDKRQAARETKPR